MKDRIKSLLIHNDTANSKVTAANTVTVQVCRVKAGSYDPAAENWTFLVSSETKNNI